MKNAIEAINRTVRGILRVTIYPPGMKSAWVMTIAWAVALLTAAIAAVAHLDDWTSVWLWYNLAFAALDIYMLRLCIQGIRYRSALRRGKVRRRA